eukprot:TRINITY_DN32636_c0_g1_i1.p1 TRINITY_DN32636_c0_g1~~TRINITY_DN32636_c0_g1_i1.p1  ORF type:complete len:765 (-),score=41.71 TRINITY_DN32636_c0_g1_i1:397-2691(-)
MFKSLPPLPSPFVLGYSLLHHEAISWNASFVHLEGPFLPTCEDSDWHSGALGRSRMLYWFTWYFLMGIITVLLCYVAHVVPRLIDMTCCLSLVERTLGRTMKGTPSHRELQAHYGEEAKQMMDSQTTEGEDAVSSKTGSMLEEGGLLDQAFPRLHLVYHAFCVTIVCVGYYQDSLCPIFGLDWELWAVWQFGMSLAAIMQALVRNLDGSKAADPGQLFAFVKPVFMSILPGMSESVDTMKDWVVTGMCFKMGSETPLISALFAVFIILADLLLAYLAAGYVDIARITVLPATCVVTVSTLFLFVAPIAEAFDLQESFVDDWSSCHHDAQATPRIALFIAWGICLVVVCISVSAGGFSEYVLLCGLFSAIAIVFLVYLFYVMCVDLWILGSLRWYATTLFLGDGVSLGILVVYIIVISHGVLYLQSDCTSSLRKSYLSILSILSPRQDVPLSFLTSLQGKVVTLINDSTSSFRETIAWNEDLPQGLLGLFCAWRSGHASGFTAFSGALSFAKAVAIPTIRVLSVGLRQRLLTRTCEDLAAGISNPLIPDLLEVFRSNGQADVHAGYMAEKAIYDINALYDIDANSQDDNNKFGTVEACARYEQHVIAGVRAVINNQIADFLRKNGTWEDKASEKVLRVVLADFLSTKFTVFEQIAQTASLECKSGITQSARKNMFEAIEAYMYDQAYALAEEAYNGKTRWMDSRTGVSFARLRVCRDRCLGRRHHIVSLRNINLTQAPRVGIWKFWSHVQAIWSGTSGSMYARHM